MIRTILCAALLLIAAPAAAEPVSLYDGRVTIDVPRGFRPATEAEIRSRYPRPQGPDHVITRDDQLSVAITVRRNELRPPEAQMPIARLGAFVVERQFSGQPAIAMHRHGSVTVNGREWYAIEFTSPAPDASRIENVVRLTVADDNLVVVSFSAFAAQFPQNEVALRAALDSAVVR